MPFSPCSRVIRISTAVQLTATTLPISCTKICLICSDLERQADQFRRGAGNPICVGVVAINRAPYCVSYEGEREFKTDGAKHRHPSTEADEAEARLVAGPASKFDEFLVLRYRATNDDPYEFGWVDYDRTFKDYGAILTRISRTYDSRFGMPVV